MKRQADRQVREEDKKQADRQACEYYGKHIQKKACTGRKDIIRERVGKGWKDKPIDRLLKRIEDKLRDRLVSKNGGHRLAKRMERRIISLISRSFSLPISAVLLRCETSENIPFSLPSKTTFSFRFQAQSLRAASSCMTGSQLVHDGQPCSWCMTGSQKLG
jgi:hypothetical protein